jgi:putative MATE family efflux protein
VATTRDLTTGPIGRTLLLFALPTLGSNILQSLNGSVNAIWVGYYLGEAALAATSNANMLMFLMFGAVFGFGMAATILVGQAMGRRDILAARQAFAAAIGLVVGASTLVAALGWWFAPEILRLLATPGDAFALALAYLRVTFLGLPASMLMVLAFMGLRGTGDANTPLWFITLSVAIDVVLNPLLIAGIGPFPQLGIAGAGWATFVANYVSATALILYIYRRDMILRLRGAELRWLIPTPALMRTIVTKGVPIGAQMIVISSAALAMVGLVNRQGVEVTAAYGVAQQLWAYIQMPALAIGAGVSAMAAQNIGAGRWDRVSQITNAGLLINLVLTGTMVVVTTVFDRAVLGLFLQPGSGAMPIAEHIQLVAAWSFILFGAMMVYFSVVRANGAVLVPLLILFVAVYPVRIGFATALLPAWGADALWWSFPIGSAVTLAGSAAYYYQGSWRRIAQLSSAAEPHAEPAQTDAEPAGRLHPTG